MQLRDATVHVLAICCGLPNLVLCASLLYALYVLCVWTLLLHNDIVWYALLMLLLHPLFTM